MRWEYAEPEAKVFVHRLGVFEQYYADDNQLIRTRISPGESGAEILSLLSGAKKLADDYALELEEGTSGGRGPIRLALIPKREGEHSRIVLKVNAATSLLDGARFLDAAGNVTEFEFRGARPDARLPADIFTIKVPRDCEVIDDLPPGRS
jgi:outer membrane lipoprotein-sorting protein